MDFKLFFLNNIIKWLIGGDVFNFIKAQVALVNDGTMTGEEKRAKVLADTKALFGGIATFLVNLAIEAAVTSLKAKLGELENGN